jgi:hypothetical protein
MAKRRSHRAPKAKFDAEIAEGLDRLAQQYRDLFGCAQSEGPLLFDVAALEDRHSMHREMVRRALDAKINPVLVFATHRTRRIVSAENEHLLTEQEREEWDAHIDEAIEAQEAGVDVSQLIRDEVYPERNCVGYQIAKDQIIALWFCAEWLGQSKKPEAPLARALIAQAVQLARVFRFASDNHYYRELVSLCRPLFEIALRVELIDRDGQLAVALRAMAGLRDGTWTYLVRSDGRKDVRSAVETATGRTVPVVISNSKLAEKSSFDGLHPVFEQIYPLLAMHTHPNATFDHELIEEPDHSHEIGFLYLNSVLSYVLGAVAVSGFLSEDHQRQIRHAAMVTLIMTQSECKSLRETEPLDADVCADLLEIVSARLKVRT